MKKDKLKNLDFRYFLAPFCILLLLFSIMTYIAVNKHISQKYLSFEQEAINIAESYSHTLTYSYYAHSIINDLLEERLKLALQAISMIENKYDNDALSEIGEKFFLDEIYLYNVNAQIIYSKDDKYLGWKAYEGHPVYNFFMSDKRMLVEDIRKDSESNNYLKYAYLKNNDGTFIQIGIKAGTIKSFLQRFELSELVKELSDRIDVMSVVYFNKDYKAVASSSPEFDGIAIVDNEIKERILNGEIYSAKTTFNGQDAFQVYVPVFHNCRVNGVLSIIWSMDKMRMEITGMIIDEFITFSVVILVIGAILYMRIQLINLISELHIMIN